MLKVGIDVHGVLDTFPEIVRLIEKLQQLDTVEIHIITGLAREHADEEIGHLVDLDSVHYFSIIDHIREEGHDIEIIDGQPFTDKKAWDKAKSIYCMKHDIDFMLDDNAEYGQYFKNPKVRTIFCHVQNNNKRRYRRHDD